MMKATKYIVLMAVLTLAWGCSSDNDSNIVSVGSGNNKFEATFSATTETPDWQVNMYSNDEKPTWQAPDRADHESSMVMLINLQDELIPFSTEDDLMAVFVNGECRATSVRNVYNNDIYFVLGVRGTASQEEATFELRYYSGGLHQVFSASRSAVFMNELTYGTDSEYEPKIIRGSHKYNCYSEVQVVMPSELPFTITENDLVGIFINGECRGTGKPTDAFFVFLDSMPANVQIRYYSDEKKGIYTSTKDVKIRSSSQFISF